MSNPQSSNLQNLAATATVVVGGVASMAKLAKDELQHRNMKYKTDPSNVYSSIRILPDLVRFEGFIRIHKHTGNIICNVPRKIEQPKQESDETPKETDSNSNNKMESNDVEHTQNINENENENKNKMIEETNENEIDTDNMEINLLKNVPNIEEQNEEKSKSSWFNSISNFASNAKKSFNKMQTFMESQTVEFDSTFTFILRESAIHRNELEEYIINNNKFLFEPISLTQSIEQIQKNNKNELPLNERWEFCAVKIHHETLYIRYARKWITLPLNNINIKPLQLKNNDCSGFIVDYKEYFLIEESKGFELLCQHLKNPFIDHLNINKNMNSISKIEIPSEHSICPLPYVQQYLIGYHNTNYISLRKEQLLRKIIEKVSNDMKVDGFDNYSCYKHCIQFRKCMNQIISKINGAEKALQFKQKQNNNNNNNNNNDEFDDNNNDISMISNENNNNNNEMKMEQKEEEEEKTNDIEMKTTNEEKCLPYLNLLLDGYHGLNIERLSELDWKLTSEASWLCNYVYDIHEPLPSQISQKRRSDSWSYNNFKSYVPLFNSSQPNLLDINNSNNNNINNINMNENNIEYRGPPHLANNILWQKHSAEHFKKLSSFGFELLDYYITQKGQSVQFIIIRSYDNPNTIFVVFKGTSNPLDAMVNIGLHPLELPHFQCSVFSGMYAALQQSLGIICRKLNLYGSEQYFKYNPCPPNNNQNITKIYRLILCGHSLGGGYAKLFLAHLLSTNEFENYFESIKCITFGAPLVFCKDVKNSFLYNKLNEKCLNFVYQFDLVPRLQNGMNNLYRNKLLQGLLISQLPVSNIEIVFDINQRLNYVLNLFQKHQWLLDRYCPIGKYICLFEKDEPKPIDKKNKCFTKSAQSNHLFLDSNNVLTITDMLPENDQIYAVQVLDDHKMLNYMKTIMFQQF